MTPKEYFGKVLAGFNPNHGVKARDLHVLNVLQMQEFLVGPFKEAPYKRLGVTPERSGVYYWQFREELNSPAMDGSFSFYDAERNEWHWGEITPFLAAHSTPKLGRPYFWWGFTQEFHDYVESLK